MEVAANCTTILFGIITTSAAIIAIIMYIRKRATTPSFLIGVIPDAIERNRKNISPQDLGIPLGGELSQIWHFNPRYFAIEEKKKKDEHDEKRQREISTSNSNYVSLPILIANIGERVAERYTLLIGFDKPSIQVTDLDPATLMPISIYTRNPHEFKNDTYRAQVTKPFLVDIYEDLGLPNAWLSFTGSLESEAYEIIHVEIKVPQDIKSFSINFCIDCPGEYGKERCFLQHIKLTGGRGFGQDLDMSQRGEVRAIFEDASALYRKAIEELERGEIRDAAEKAWRAMVRATNGLILAMTGVRIEGSLGTSKEFAELMRRDREVGEKLRTRYYTRETSLHDHCFYMGIVDPEVEREIRETNQYIEDAKKLAGIGE